MCGGCEHGPRMSRGERDSVGTHTTPPHAHGYRSSGSRGAFFPRRLRPPQDRVSNDPRLDRSFASSLACQGQPGPLPLVLSAGGPVRLSGGYPAAIPDYRGHSANNVGLTAIDWPVSTK